MRSIQDQVLYPGPLTSIYIQEFVSLDFVIGQSSLYEVSGFVASLYASEQNIMFISLI